MSKKNPLVKRKLQTRLMGRGLLVSTIEMFIPGAKSSLIETVVFHRQTGNSIWGMREAKTWEEAKTNHKTMVAKWKVIPRRDIRKRVEYFKRKT